MLFCHIERQGDVWGGIMLLTFQDWTRLPCFMRSPVNSSKTTRFVQPRYICQAKQASVMDLLQSAWKSFGQTQNRLWYNHMLSLGCIQMLLYFSLEDGSKKMAGTGVVSQSGTDLEPGLKIYCSSWGRVRPSEWTHIKIQGLHAAHSQPILNKILKARKPWLLLLTRSHHLYLFRYFWMDGDMRATWVVQGHGGGGLGTRRIPWRTQ